MQAHKKYGWKMIKKHTKIKFLENGASLTEYGLLLGLLAAISIVTVFNMGWSTKDSFCATNETLTENMGVDATVECIDAAGGAGPGVGGSDVEPLGPANFVATMEGTNVMITLAGNGEIDWGGETTQTFSVGNTLTPFFYTFASGGQHTVEISGTMTKLGDMDGVVSIDDFGEVGLESLESTFAGENNLVSVAPLPPTVTKLTGILDGSTVSSVSGLEAWDVSNVTTFVNTFWRTQNFNQDISGWDTSSAINMSGMFADAISFNQDISGWDVSNVTSFTSMFLNADSFNAPIGSWNMSSARSMSQMFRYTDGFVQDISSWDVSNVTSFRRLFAESSG